MTYLYIFIFIELVFLKVKGNEDILNGVVVIFRHGDRTPVNPYPNDPYKNTSFWPVDFGQLTNKGKQQHYQLGQWLRSRYNGFLPTVYSEKDVYILSTDVDRTLMSAEANLAGLYPPTSNEIWKQDLKWQPIPIHTKPQLLDALLASKNPCAKYDALHEQLYKTEYFRNISKKNHDLYAYLTKKTGSLISDLQKIQYLYSNLFIEVLHNYTLPLWTTKVYPHKLQPLASLGFAVDTFTPEMAKFKTGPLFDHIIKFFNNRTSKSPESQKLLIFSAHDTTIANVLNSMGAFEYHCPPFTSTILMELRKSSNGDDYVNIFYKNSSQPRPIVLKNCDFNCNLTEFINILKPITINLDNWEKECKLHWTLVWPLTFQWNIILICSFITVILLLSAVIIGVKKSKKECDNNYIQIPNEEYA